MSGLFMAPNLKFASFVLSNFRIIGTKFNWEIKHDTRAHDGMDSCACERWWESAILLEVQSFLVSAHLHLVPLIIVTHSPSPSMLSFTPNEPRLTRGEGA